MMNLMRSSGGMYDPTFEHDNCGVGAVVNISGKKNHAIIQHAKQVLTNLLHRGATGGDESTGDGAGILLQIPHAFFANEAQKLGFTLPPAGHYGVGMIFLPSNAKLRRVCENAVEESAKHYNVTVLGWRDVPCNSNVIGDTAKSSEPTIRQIFLSANDLSVTELERKLYLVRKRAERIVLSFDAVKPGAFYVCSMSCNTIVYKGLFMAPQLFSYFADLEDERVITALALVHQRYSTNTFPTWHLAQPFRMVAHNGEINTLRGNLNRMQSREQRLANPLFGDAIDDLIPVAMPGGSDSACFDNVLELLVQAGRDLPHAAMMMIPEAFGPAYHMSTAKRAFYEYHAAIMEPWDGPAAMLFTDGTLIGGTLDRNGLRPARYVVTTDGLVVLASETGVIEFPADRIQKKGRLQPGRMFLVDLDEQRIVTDNEIKSRVTRQKPYLRWLEKNGIELRGLFTGTGSVKADSETINQRLRAFGYSREDLKMILAPMAQHGQEPVGSMGTDTPLAVLSNRPKLLFSYFKQLFAQVTNPAIDPLREGLVMSLMTFIGKDLNLLDETPQHCRQIKVPHPILTSQDMERLRSANMPEIAPATIPALFDALADNPGESLKTGLDQLVQAAEAAIENGATLLIISDRGISESQAAIPCLLAASAVHHGLLTKRMRDKVGLIIESGEPREVAHFCLLVGFGISAVYPYLAYEAFDEMQHRGELPADIDSEDLVDNYITAIKKGLLKTMAKMGISTLRSYRGAQLFEAVGLNSEVVETYFAGTPTRVGGAGLDVIAEETLKRHRFGFRDRQRGELKLGFEGEYHYRADGETHAWNPESIYRLQHAVRTNDAKAFAEYSKALNEQSRKGQTLRGLFDLVPGKPIPIDEVQPANEIVKRFCTGAMSHGSISKEAHETLAIAMNRLGGMSNTGEGGEDPYRYEPLSNGDSMNSAIKQIASGRFGVTINYLSHAKELQIKVAQGAKPGEGGQLPGHKVTDEIARLRHSTPGVSLISPPPHHDIYSIEDLAQLIYDLKCSNPGVKVSVKLVAEVGVGTVAAGVAKANADEVLISGHDGGTGASPLSSIKHTGIPWELGLAETQQVLVMNGLRDRIRLQTDGHLKTGRDVVIAALLGAERYGFGTGALISLGCVMMRKCHLGGCPAGIATQDPDLRQRFAGKPEHLERFMLFVAEEVREIMAQLGFRTIQEMVGRSDRLAMREAIDNWKAKGLDLSNILFNLNPSRDHATYCTTSPTDPTTSAFDWELLKSAQPALDDQQPVEIKMPIRNVDRTVGAILSNKIVTKFGPSGLPNDTIQCEFTGSAGQSFGAFLAPGVTLRLVGDANDYLGKGLSGGRIIVQTPPNAAFSARKNVIAGNTLLYGATSGEVFINGLVGERFAVRNSGATAVVEGVGDHCCEYMTGGTVVVLRSTGRNFAAGMSGGIAYVLDEHQLFDTLCNCDMVELETVWRSQDIDKLRQLIERHYQWTNSKQAARILEDWQAMVGRFVKVIPTDYRKALERQRAEELAQTDFTPATEEVYDD